MFFPKKSTLKKFLICSQHNVLLIFREIELSYVFFITSFFLFPETEFSGPKIKKIIILSYKKVFLIFPEIQLSSPKNKKIQEGIFPAGNIKKTLSEKSSCI